MYPPFRNPCAAIIGRLALLSLCLCLTGATGCDSRNDDDAPLATRVDDEQPYDIVATTGMVADVVRHVAGDEANVTQLMGEGVDPHLYNPTRTDVATLSAADLIFYSGLMLEGRMSDVMVRLGRNGKPVYAVTEELDPEFLLEPEGFAGHWDPHVWMDVNAWMQTLSVVEQALTRYDPAHAEQYAVHAQAYREQLQALDRYVTQAIASIPEQQRVLVTAHDAFNYFGRAYDIQVQAVQGLSTESEAGVDDINQLVDFLVQRGIGAIFIESSVSDKNIRALIEGAAQQGHEVVIGGSLFSDAMGGAGTYEGTYIGMIDLNATVIARALGGEAPAGGMQGRLSQ